MTTDNHIDYVEFPAGSLPETKAFFQAVFGWTFTDYGPEYVAFNGSGLEGGFFQSDLVAKTDQGSALVVLYHSNLTDVAAKIEEHGGTISKPEFSFPGGSRFHFLDPNGNEFAVWTKSQD